MKRILFTVASAELLLASCDHFHMSDNGKLDGFWQLTDVDSLPTGHSADVRELQIFWAVQADLLEVRGMDLVHLNVFFRFDHSGSTLTLRDPVVDNRLISDSLVNDVNTINYYGLSHLTETLKVLRLDSKKMTLESERLRMYFRKY